MWVYAVCEQPELGLPRIRGLAGAPVAGIALGPMLAVVSRHQRLPEGRSLDALWLHERVVEALMAERAVLPMRFGTRMPDRDAVRAALAARRESLLDALDRVRGRVELAVRAIRPDAAAAAGDAPTSGVEYLRIPLRSTRLADSLHEPLAALAVAAHRWPEHAPGEVLRASYLVDQPAVLWFRRAADRLQGQHPEAAVLCTGPWPPYSFVEGVG